MLKRNMLKIVSSTYGRAVAPETSLNLETDFVAKFLRFQSRSRVRSPGFGS